jgi:sugar O-acyltransferase (sialic acid O-acetyltransferase NeuD family)
LQKLIIWGAGGHGKVVLDIARSMAIFAEIVFVDDARVSKGQSFCDCELLPSSQGLKALKARGHGNFVVAIGDNRIRERCFRQGIEQGLDAATLIHPSALVSGSVRTGKGTVVMPRVVVNADTVIGDNCILNTGAIVEHDCRIGNHVHLAPGVTLGGNVTVETHSFLGIGTIVLPGAMIGAGAVLGAGAVVLDSAPSGATSVGVPAKVLAKAKSR